RERWMVEADVQVDAHQLARAPVGVGGAHRDDVEEPGELVDHLAAFFGGSVRAQPHRSAPATACGAAALFVSLGRSTRKRRAIAATCTASSQALPRPSLDLTSSQSSSNSSRITA